MTVIQIIHQFCQSTGCPAADIVLEWDVQTGARLTATGPSGKRHSLNVLCGLNHMAQALLLVVNGEEERYPQMLQEQNRLEAKIRSWQAEEGGREANDGTGDELPTEEEAAVKDWRGAKNPDEILKSFPLRPKADELIDLYQLNKKFASPELVKLLNKHSR